MTIVEEVVPHGARCDAVEAARPRRAPVGRPPHDLPERSRGGIAAADDPAVVDRRARDEDGRSGPGLARGRACVPGDAAVRRRHDPREHRSAPDRPPVHGGAEARIGDAGLGKDRPRASAVATVLQPRPHLRPYIDAARHDRHRARQRGVERGGGAPGLTAVGRGRDRGRSALRARRTDDGARDDAVVRIEERGREWSEPVRDRVRRRDRRASGRERAGHADQAEDDHRGEHGAAWQVHPHPPGRRSLTVRRRRPIGFASTGPRAQPFMREA